MILVTVGTNEQPFDRLVRAAAALGGTEPLLVQYGSSQVPHGRGEWVDFLPFDVLAERAREARVVVCHAGVGSIMLARRCGRRALVMPRRHHLGEAVDDHQVELAKSLAHAGLVTRVDNRTELEAALNGESPVGQLRFASRLSGAEALGAELRGVLTDLGARPIARPTVQAA